MRPTVTCGAFFALVVLVNHLQGQDVRPATRDSAGIAIVSYPSLPRQLPTLARVGTTPDLVMGNDASDPRTLLSQVSSAVRMPSGMTAVVNAKASAILFFDSRGKLVTSVGRRGQGPGEFESLSWIKKYGPTSVIAYDRARRVTVLSDSGALVKLSALPGIPVGLFANGTLLMSMRMPRAIERDGSATRDSSLYMSYGTEPPFAVRDTIGMLPNSDLAVTRTTQLPNGTMMATGYSMPFGRVATAVTIGDAFVFGDGARFELMMYSSSGALLRVVRIAENPRTVSPADMTTWVSAFAGRMSVELRNAAVESMKTIPAPKSWPAFGRILSDDTGRIWVQTFAIDEKSAQNWLVFDKSGSLLGQIGTPAGLQVLDVGTTYVLGLRKDADDVESVVMYTLTPAR